MARKTKCIDCGTDITPRGYMAVRCKVCDQERRRERARQYYHEGRIAAKQLVSDPRKRDAILKDMRTFLETVEAASEAG